MWNKISLKSLEKRKNKKYIIELLLEKKTWSVIKAESKNQ